MGSDKGCMDTQERRPILGAACKRQGHRCLRKKLRPVRILGFMFSLVALSALSFSALTRSSGGLSEPALPQESLHQSAPHRTLLFTQHQMDPNVSADIPIAMQSTANSNKSQGDYPPDAFTLEERRQGAVAFHMFGMIYMFIALAIVCDEFFVPALTVITEKLTISDDVAGATFMAAGGSAPELFTSIIGVFISHSNVGIGTIVGSAVFNILFVIGMCAIFSKEILNLTWWPLFRDVSFYILDLILLIIFFLDNIISMWESITLLSGYAAYVIFMKFNSSMEGFVKRCMNNNQVVEVAVQPKDEKASPGAPEDDGKLSARPRLQRGGSSASLHNSLMRNSIFQLMIHTLDPLSEEFADSELGTYGKLKYYHSMTEEGKFREKASILHKIAKKKCQVEDSEKANGVASRSDKNLPNSSSVEVEVTPPMNGTAGQEGETAEDEEEEDQPLSLSWPETNRKRLTYLLIIPIVLPLWLTLPDVRKPTAKKFFPISFLGSITWIAGFSYLMVWWAHQVGETIGITEEIMGLTILAAGTSIPDLITSVIVARKGLGDMAVSSSVGSNIFDITVGLPFPWLLWSFFNGMQPVKVSSNGLFCAIVLLFLMLLFVIISIAACKWRMSKLLGFIMFMLYFVFLVVSVMLEDKVIACPVSV
ncbi:sodium/potassium/calcium exchanger 2-like isoform X1 [Hippoglossus hippoglossus]|uniref:sodium/potassium/calcium exchanger 2-like isoform X1 n=1 Tax=Hippoglossus hippoglossus TaxID=8267 RepID=UPI00148BD5B1|nr:sodium/potassium/calcium exchanger 2-like isoform X1 [Hippoglossus hippoglossus]XP_034425369.1 sodium/potassium/calcium exchanger 2-like isoform X1 [Hippoglossus hippoglossus]XP_034425370.1 sodium/potassium/calcium exchanger 2-like isoform X1 [Hippoglossus hippoglossus]XP_034425371.1 sodium/potassium/calcium exchanger 2-like isoform X1 [Hippoglossus hippoglossus]XP_035005553.1 sodium/potassium/calcium exchanger 2 isoform X1 [Hippoglossus stenolepis]XP_035005554.1 sodium/potassium/calcium ex